MINEQLQKKIDRAIKLLQAYNDPDNPVEVAYSGGKDSDVILQLAKEAGINYRAIYKCTTIDPKGTIKHVKSKGVEVRMPKVNFFTLIQRKGLPSRFARFCCQELKEYKILNKCIMGVRQAESKAREKRYQEPTACRYYDGRTEKSPDAAEHHVEAIYPIHNWSDEDVEQFISDRKIQCHPLYYDADGVFHVERRLGCIGCPMANRKERLLEFKNQHKYVKAWIKAASVWFQRPNIKAHEHFDNVYELFVFNLFFDDLEHFYMVRDGLFGKMDCKQKLEDYFNIKL